MNHSLCCANESGKRFPSSLRGAITDLERLTPCFLSNASRRTRFSGDKSPMRLFRSIIFIPLLWTGRLQWSVSSSEHFRMRVDLIWEKLVCFEGLDLGPITVCAWIGTNNRSV